VQRIDVDKLMKSVRMGGAAGDTSKTDDILRKHGVIP
jgi:hypothetical protein